MKEGDVRYIVALACSQPTMFLNEYRRQFLEQRLLDVSLPTIHRAFQRYGLNIKHVQKLAKEWCPIKCARFIRHIAQYPPQYIVPVDETSKDDRTYMQLFA
jgi:hypothetical protein